VIDFLALVSERALKLEAPLNALSQGERPNDTQDTVSAV
jgi:hypothetical protein